MMNSLSRQLDTSFTKLSSLWLLITAARVDLDPGWVLFGWVCKHSPWPAQGQMMRGFWRRKRWGILYYFKSHLGLRGEWWLKGQRFIDRIAFTYSALTENIPSFFLTKMQLAFKWCFQFITSWLMFFRLWLWFPLVVITRYTQSDEIWEHGDITIKSSGPNTQVS